MNSLVKFAVASIAGLGFGVVSAQSLINGYGDFFNQRHGPWTSYPTAGTRSSNPYVRAHYLTHNRLPISQLEINELEARVDSEGSLLDGNCSYQIRGRMPKTRWWSLYTFSEDGQAPYGSRSGIASQQVFFRDDGTYTINLSSEPKTGNWLVPTGDDELVIVLRHYNPGKSIANQFKFDNLPTITKGVCR